MRQISRAPAQENLHSLQSLHSCDYRIHSHTYGINLRSVREPRSQVKGKAAKGICEFILITCLLSNQSQDVPG